MAISTTELKARFKAEDLMSKEIKRMQKQLREFKKETRAAQKELEEFQSTGKKNTILKTDTKKAKKDIDGAKKKIKDYDKSVKNTNPTLKLSLKDLTKGGISGVKDKLKGLNKGGKISMKLLGKSLVLTVLAMIGKKLLDLGKSTYTDIKVKINDMTQWGIQKIKQGLSTLKDKVIKVTLDGYDQYSDYRARASSLDLGGVDFNKFDKLVQKSAKNSRTAITDARNGIVKLMQMAPDAFGKKPEDAAKFYQTTMQSFRRGGASGQEASAAMYQLNQGLASGVLQGDELRSIRENAPLLAKMIEKEVGTGIKEAGKQGLLTADVVKRAVLKHADEVNEEFKNIPLNFSDAWSMASQLIEAKVLTPMYERMQNMFNLDKVKNFFEGMFTGAEKALDGLWKLFDMTNFGGIDFSILQGSFAPLGDFISDIYNHIVSGSPEAQEAINVLGQVVNGAFEGMEDVFVVFKDIAADVFKFLKENPNFIRDVIKLLASDWKRNWSEMEFKMQAAADYVIPLLTGVNNAVTGIIDAVKGVIEWWDKMKRKLQENIRAYVDTGGGNGVDVGGKPKPRRAMGQNTIPYDGFVIKAHQGEKLLNKREAQAYDSGRSGIGAGLVLNMYDTVFNENADFDLFMHKVVKNWKLAKEGGV